MMGYQLQTLLVTIIRTLLVSLDSKFVALFKLIVGVLYILEFAELDIVYILAGGGGGGEGNDRKTGRPNLQRPPPFFDGRWGGW